MSDFFETPSKNSVPDIRIEKTIEQNKELKYIGWVRVYRGHSTFSYNLKTGEIKLAPIKDEVSVDIKTKLPIRKHKIVIEKDCIYRQALNKKSFIKRLKREGVIKED